MFDFVAVTGTQEGRMIEYTKHLHEHFVAPVELAGGRYRAPLTPGIGMEMLRTSLDTHRFVPSS
jgi:L-fuconate dehydratase